MNVTCNGNLSVHDLNVRYGHKLVVSKVSFTVNPGEIAALIGPNGAGKTTILKAIAGLTTSAGKVILGDKPFNGLSPEKRVAQGMSYCPQGNRVFDELTVLENLQVSGHMLSSARLGIAIERSLSEFPILGRLSHQPAGVLSGGEQQMLALARALVPDPQLLLLDEPTAGLTPLLTVEVFKMIRAIAARKIAVLIVEQNVGDVLQIADNALCLKAGQMVYWGPARQLATNENQLTSLFF